MDMDMDMYDYGQDITVTNGVLFCSSSPYVWALDRTRIRMKILVLKRFNEVARLWNTTDRVNKEHPDCIVTLENQDFFSICIFRPPVSIL